MVPRLQTINVIHGSSLWLVDEIYLEISKFYWARPLGVRALKRFPRNLSSRAIFGILLGVRNIYETYTGLYP